MAHEGDVFEGKTLDAAVRNGLDALRLSRAEVMITILEEGAGGFLGIGSRPYRVRVMRRPGGAPTVEPEAGSPEAKYGQIDHVKMLIVDGNKAIIGGMN